MPQLDFSHPSGYNSGVEWVRENIVLKKSASGEGVVQLDVKAPGDTKATLFMDPRNHYLMAFGGKDKIYLLDDDGTPEFKKSLVKFLGSDKNVEELPGLKTSHNALGTFTREESGLKARIFKLSDLKSVRVLSEYSRRDNLATYEALREPLSLLVCMISESARIPMMQRDFANMYFGHSVVADDAIRSFHDAQYLGALSRNAFPAYPSRLGVEKLQKRALEFQDLIAAIEALAGGSNRQKLLQEVLDGQVPPGAASIQNQIKRFRDMARELEMRNAGDITQLISTCKSESAVRAAKQGVVIPPIEH